VVCCANFTTSLLCSIGPVNKALCANEMSNQSLKDRIEKSIEQFRAGKLSIKDLKNSIEINGQALEMMPYELIKELDEIEYKLTVSQFTDEEECFPNIEGVLIFIKSWLTKVPIENV